MTSSDKIAIGVAVASTILGLIALAVSMRANRISRDAHQLARDAYFGERRIFLKSERGPHELLLSTSSEDQTINTVTIYFPAKLGIEPISLAASNLSLHETRVQHQLKRYWDSITPTAKRGFATVRLTAATPVVGVVHGHTKGVASITTGFYDLYSLYIRDDKGSSSVTIESLAFNNYDVSGRDPQTIANELLEKVESVLLARQKSANLRAPFSPPKSQLD